MLAAEVYNKSVLASYNPALSEIYGSTISLHHAKEGYEHPIIRLRHTLSKLARLPVRVYQTLHKGALAFLVVIAPKKSSNDVNVGRENDAVCSGASVFTRRRSPVRIRPGPLFFAMLMANDVRVSQSPNPRTVLVKRNC